MRKHLKTKIEKGRIKAKERIESFTHCIKEIWDAYTSGDQTKREPHVTQIKSSESPSIQKQIKSEHNF